MILIHLVGYNKKKVTALNCDSAWVVYLIHKSWNLVALLLSMLLEEAVQAVRRRERQDELHLLEGMYSLAETKSGESWVSW